MSIQPAPDFYCWHSRGRALHWHIDCLGLRGISDEPQSVYGAEALEWLERVSDRHWCRLCYQADRKEWRLP